MNIATPDSTQTETVQSEKDVIRATRAFARESKARSWAHVAVTFMLLTSTLVAASTLPWWPARLVASVLAGLLLVRAFILYHDYMHGAILRDSRLAQLIFFVYGVLVLTPPVAWKTSHNFHHANVGKIKSMAIGSFPILTTEMWRKASPYARFKYRISRHPLTILSAYFTVFLIGICIAPFLQNPRKHWDSVVSVVIHFGLAAVIWIFAGWQIWLSAFLLPVAIASALGAYLFYAQHNFVGMYVLAEEEWTYYRAALETASCLQVGPVLRWFTGNIGFHHIHHLNPAIPFYRLPEAMAAIPALQRPNITTLRPSDILACLRLNLWDTEERRMIGYSEVNPT